MTEQSKPVAGTESRRPGGRMAGATAAVVATGALACGVCCVLPFALPAAVLASTGGALAWLGSAWAGMTAVALAAVLTAWIWIGAQRWRTKRKLARSTVYVMTFATLVLIAALAWPCIELWVFTAIRR